MVKACHPRNAKKLPTRRQLQHARSPASTSIPTREERAIRKQILDPIVKKLLDKKLNSKSQRLSRNDLLNTLNLYKHSLPWLSLDMLKSKISRDYKKASSPTTAHLPLPSITSTPPADAPTHMITTTTTTVTTTTTTEVSSRFIAVPPPPGVATNPDTSRKKGGRPKGSTIKNSVHLNKCVTSAKNEIALAYYSHMQYIKAANKKFERHAFKKIHDEIKKKRNLPDSFNMTYKAVTQRIRRGNIIRKHGTTRGPTSPLADIESDIVEFAIVLARTGTPLSAGELLPLINSMINGTQYQKKLKDYKVSLGFEPNDPETALAGLRYYKGFMERNHEKIVSKRGKKFEMDRSNWTTYLNFAQMYDDIEEELIDAGLAIKNMEYEWMNKEGEICEENDSFGMKVSIKITHPHLCFCMDEVGSNTSMIKDGHFGGRLFICARDSVPREIASKKDKKWTCLSVTAFNGEQVMLVIIIEGVKRNLTVESGIDTTVPVEDIIGSESDNDFFIKNCGEGKLFPGGHTCVFRGKEVPCMVRFTESSGINTEILTDIVHTLDELDLFAEE
jgi:hypothetical protein